MTCIVGVEDPKTGAVYLGCDMLASNGHSSGEVDTPKVFVNGGITFGYTSSFRFADILQHNLVVPPRSKDVTDDRQYLIAALVPAIRHALGENGWTEVTSNRERGGTVIIVYNKKLYTIQDDFSVIRYTCGYAACGSGTDFAIGSLATTAVLKVKPQDRVRFALEAAILHCCTVGGVPHIYTIKV